MREKKKNKFWTKPIKIGGKKATYLLIRDFRRFKSQAAKNQKLFSILSDFLRIENNYCPFTFIFTNKFTIYKLVNSTG